MSSQQSLLMDVDPNIQEDELSTISSSHALRRSTSLRTFRDTSRQRAASRQQPFVRAPSSQPTPTPQDDLRKKADRILRFLGYFSRDLQETKDAQHMAFREMSNIGQGFAAGLERQTKRILEGEVIIGEELDMLNNALGQWIEEVSRLQAQALAKIIICVPSVLSFRRSGRSKRQPPFQTQRLPDVTSGRSHPVPLHPDAIPTSIPVSPAS